MPELLDINRFLEERKNGYLLLDARSEKEFEQGHIKGAVNVPLLNNEHRHLVGIAYKKDGREAAVELGFELAGPLFSSYIRKVKELTEQRTILTYCWRGGMRSGIMSWILSMAGYKIFLLKGGYKTYRHFVLEKVSENYNLAIVSGKTGSGKTAILKEMKTAGAQVIDLEHLAHHRGSAFGNIGLPPQPTNEQFENHIAEELITFDASKIIWAEGESHSIGRNKIPDHFFTQMQSAPMAEVEASEQYRMKRILDEYGQFSNEELAECTKKLSKRLGDLKMREAVNALLSGDKLAWLQIILPYYDKTYSYSIAERTPTEKQTIPVNENDDPSRIAKEILKIRFSSVTT
jgi:tRNA 2-selenouridine synthase